MDPALRFLVNGLIVAFVIAGQVCAWRVTRNAITRLPGHRRPFPVRLLVAALSAGAGVIVWLDSSGIIWSRGLHPFFGRLLSFGAGIWIAGWTGVALILLLENLAVRRVSLSRRDFLRTAARAAALAPFGAAAYGTLLVRRRFELREVDFPARHLPPALENLRIVLLTDIHLGPYLSVPELDRVIDMANDARPQLTLVTGDLITVRSDPLETCLSRLARLRAEAGVFGCLGNHEIYANCQEFAEQRGRALGIEFLRARAHLLEFGGARLNLAGVDYQAQRYPYLVGAGRLLAPNAVNLLLSHNPDVFPVAADLGYDLVVGGHTHGGQVTVEILEQTANIGRFITPFVAGLYRRPSSSLYVSRGIGTINLPIRLGVPPEVTVLQLRRA